MLLEQATDGKIFETANSMTTTGGEYDLHI